MMTFPSPLIAHFKHTYLYRINRPTQVIYLFLLGCLILMLASLPFITVRLSSNAPLVIEPMSLRQTLVTSAAGRVQRVYVKENVFIKKGDTILTMNPFYLHEQTNLLRKRYAELQLLNADVSLLLNNDVFVIPIPKLRTAYFRSFTDERISKIHSAEASYHKEKADYDRFAGLYAKQLVPAMEYDKYKQSYENAKQQLETLKSNIYNECASHQLQYKKEMTELASQINKLQEQESQYTLVASTDGYLLSWNNIQPGMYLNASSSIGELTPTHQNIATAYVSPEDIGYIYPEQMVHLQIDAYNYNLWGMIPAKIIDISNDALTNGKDNRVYFKVRCRMGKTSLQLKNGFKVNIKKGMTGIARFSLNEISLYDLLFSKMDKWLNPNLKQQNFVNSSIN